MATATKTTKLTLTDLDAALDDDRHNGYGYRDSSYLSESKKARLDRAVVAVANELGLDYEALFHWSNSKYGRHLCDAASGEGPTREVVRGYLNADAVEVLYRELGLWGEDAPQLETYSTRFALTEDAVAKVREGLGAVLMAAAEEKDRNDDEILSPDSVEWVYVPTNYGSADWSIQIKTKDGRTFRVSTVEIS